MRDVIEKGDGKLLITCQEPPLHDSEKNTFELTQAKLIKGIGMYLSEENHESIGNWDAGVYDAILQYALFGKGIYG